MSAMGSFTSFPCCRTCRPSPRRCLDTRRGPRVCPPAGTVTTRMKPSVIVWDLETVPDLSGFAAANDLVGKSDVEVREAIGDKFPKHIYHSIVCIGALMAHREPDHWAVDAVGAPHVGERTEKDLITAFCAKIAT